MRVRTRRKILMWTDAICILLLICSLVYVNSRTSEMEAKLERARYRVHQLEGRHNALAADYEFRIAPAQIDASQRAWFDELLKGNPDQARSVDGKYTRER